MAKQIGTYANTKIDFKVWMKEMTVPISKPKGKASAKTIVHPIFFRCIEFTNDEFWISKFRDASNNKFPKGFSFSDNILTFKKNGKNVSVPIPDHPEMCSVIFKNFLYQSDNIRSETDIQNEQNQQREQREQRQQREQQTQSSRYGVNGAGSNGGVLGEAGSSGGGSSGGHGSYIDEKEHIVTWENATKKNRKVLLDIYIDFLTNSMKLNVAEKKNLRYTINNGVIFKRFTKYNIVVHDRAITRIDGLCWDGLKRRFYINPNLEPQHARSSGRSKDKAMVVDTDQKDTIPSFEVKWVQLTKLLDKKCAKYSYNHYTIPDTGTGTEFDEDDERNERDERDEEWSDGDTDVMTESGT